MKTGSSAFAAVDLGASSGRVLLGRIGRDRLETEVVHRFDNEPTQTRDGLCWDLEALWSGMLTGLAAAARCADLVSIGIDSWAVDYGLLDASENLLHQPFHYRDGRTDGVLERVRDELGAEHIYARTGLAFQPFNTIYQLRSEPPARLAAAAHLLLIPDLLNHRLTGRLGTEPTNASTTQLYDPDAAAWAEDLIDAARLPRRIFGPLREAGTSFGPVTAACAGGIGARPPVVSVASHDTASAVAGVPAAGAEFAYISCGTWSLVGVELERPVKTPEGMAANFTNEVGVEGTIRYLRHVMGLWLLQECLREWRRDDPALELDGLLAAASDEPRGVEIDADASEFLAPGDMPARIRSHCEQRGLEPPIAPPAVTRCILESLATAHARAIDDAARLSGRRVDVVHLVGGGARNALLCRLTADACGRPVVAGPVEATAIGNLLVQARAAGLVGGRAEMRRLCRRTQDLTTYRPR